VCHGAAGLLSARRPDGSLWIAGRRVNGFTNAEEAAAGTTSVVPFMLEDRLRHARHAAGAYVAGLPHDAAGSGADLQPLRRRHFGFTCLNLLLTGRAVQQLAQRGRLRLPRVLEMVHPASADSASPDRCVR